MCTADESEFFRKSFVVLIDAIVVLGKVDGSISVGITNLKEAFDCSRTFFRTAFKLFLGNLSTKNRVRDRFSGSESRQSTGQRFLGPNFRQENRTGF